MQSVFCLANRTTPSTNSFLGKRDKSLTNGYRQSRYQQLHDNTHPSYTHLAELSPSSKQETFSKTAIPTAPPSPYHSRHPTQHPTTPTNRLKHTFFTSLTFTPEIIYYTLMAQNWTQVPQAAPGPSTQYIIPSKGKTPPTSTATIAPLETRRRYTTAKSTPSKKASPFSSRT